MLLPPRIAAVLIAAAAAGRRDPAAWRAATDDGAVAATVLTVVSIGALMAAFGRVTRVNRELRETREELATLAVAEERLRIARDLHDLLGHSLSVIALKSELAARLLERDPARAAAELRGDPGRHARGARRGARGGQAATAGSRSRSRSTARASALAAAGIDCELAEAPPDRCRPTSTPCSPGRSARAPRTSSATAAPRHCEIRIQRRPTSSAALEIDDDGRAVPAPEHGGSGLDGLRERAQRVRGTLEAGPRPEGGFRLRVTVPLAEP